MEKRRVVIHPYDDIKARADPGLGNLENLITDLGGGRGRPDRLFWRWQRISYRASFGT